MWSVFSKYCKQRYSGADLKTRTGSMPSQARHSLAEEVAQSLGDAQDPETGENVEGILSQIEDDLKTSNQQLAGSEEKEQFLATRIKKYNELLKQQEVHLKELEKDPEKQEHYHEQLQKQQTNKEALGKVVDVHIQILKNCRELKRTIAGLEMKKAQLTNTTKQFREFLVMAEEADREQEAGIEQDLEMREMEPLTIVDDAGGDENGTDKCPQHTADTAEAPDEQKAFIQASEEESDKQENIEDEEGATALTLVSETDLNDKKEEGQSSDKNDDTEPSESTPEISDEGDASNKEGVTDDDGHA